MSEQTQLQYKQQRRSRRAKMARPMRVRPSDPRDAHFEDLPVSVNVSKEGIYFHTRRETYLVASPFWRGGCGAALYTVVGSLRTCPDLQVVQLRTMIQSSARNVKAVPRI